MDNLKGFEKICLGASDIATLIAVGCKDSEELSKERVDNPNADFLKVYPIHFGDSIVYWQDNLFYDAYVVTDPKVAIPDGYKKTCTFSSWLKIYDDDGLVFKSNPKFKEIEIYENESYFLEPIIIRCK